MAGLDREREREREESGGREREDISCPGIDFKKSTENKPLPTAVSL